MLETFVTGIQNFEFLISSLFILNEIGIYISLRFVLGTKKYFFGSFRVLFKNSLVGTLLKV